MTARLAYVSFDGAEAIVAAQATPKDTQLDEAFLSHHCRDTLAAIERMCDWLGRWRKATALREHGLEAEVGAHVVISPVESEWGRAPREEKDTRRIDHYVAGAVDDPTGA